MRKYSADEQVWGSPGIHSLFKGRVQHYTNAINNNNNNNNKAINNNNNNNNKAINNNNNNKAKPAEAAFGQ